MDKMTEPCNMCGTKTTAETYKETEGFCSYHCASGGGYTAPKPRKLCLRVMLHYDDPYCPYCYLKCLRDMGPQAHKRASCDECGYNEDGPHVKPRCATERPSTHDWCSKTADHKHINGPTRVVGQSWHGPVHFWNCTECAYEFGDH